MPFVTITPRLAAATAAIACAAAGAAVVAAPGEAQQTGSTYTFVSPEGRPRGFAQLDVAPKGLNRGRTSLGDKLFITTSILRDGAVKGTAELEVTARDSGSVRKGRGSAFVTAVYHFSDGDLALAGLASFDDSATQHAVVTGGTGVFAGARGTMESVGNRDTVRLLR